MNIRSLVTFKHEAALQASRSEANVHFRQATRYEYSVRTHVHAWPVRVGT